MSLHHNGVNGFLFGNGKEIFQFQADNKNVNFPTQSCLGSISNGFRAHESGEVPLNGNVYHFSVDYNSINKSSILNIHKYLIMKIEYKMFEIIKKMFIVLLPSIVNASNHTKCVSLSNQKCGIQSTLINLHPNEYNQEFHYYPFSVKLDRCVRSYNK